MNPSRPRSRSNFIWGFLIFVVLLWGITLAIAACQDDVGSMLDSTSEQEPTEVAGNTDPEPETEPTEPAATSTPANTPEPDPTATSVPEPTPTEDGADEEPDETPTPAPSPTPEAEPLDIPEAAYLSDMSHMYQTMNNCSAASVCMLLSYYGIVLDQEQLRPEMRPNDDTKHGKYEYIINYIREQGFEAELMHGGDVETLQAFLAHNIPVIVQQWLDPGADDPIGHYRVVRGYDDEAGVFRVNDSMNGADVRYSYEEFDGMWRAFSYRYIPVYEAEDQEIVDRILGEERDRDVNRERTLERIEAELEERPDDGELWYSLGTNLHDLERDEEAVEAYEHARELGLPPKMLWYVTWPAEAYNNAGRHQEAIQVAEAEISTAGTFGDMRFERARAYEAIGETDLAIAEYRQALVDDPRLSEADEALNRLGAQ